VTIKTGCEGWSCFFQNQELLEQILAITRADPIAEKCCKILEELYAASAAEAVDPAQACKTRLT